MKVLNVSLRLLFAVVVISAPFYASAGILSFIVGLLKGEEVADSHLASVVTSQNMPLLQAVVNTDPVLAKGGGDITIVNGTALLPESGPNGSLADVGVGGLESSQISVYVVRPGDTLSQIAKMYNVTVNTIAWSNDIKGGLIREGQTLVILPISGVRHTVKKGDTLQSIAKLYKGDLDEIIAYNGLSENATLVSGQMVIVPDGEIATPKVATSQLIRGSGGPSYDDFYIRPINGGRRSQGLHGYNGVDLATYTGSSVMAAASGRVLIARAGGWNGGYGSYIVIQHGNDTQTLYSHLNTVNVSAGQYVSQGQVIGTVGSTGKSTGPHLHFEIRGAKNPF